MQEFCRESLDAPGRDTALDLWGRPYALFAPPKTMNPAVPVELRNVDSKRFMIVSAGEDSLYVTRDDVVSRVPDTDPMRRYSSWIDKLEAQTRSGDGVNAATTASVRTTPAPPVLP